MRCFAEEEDRPTHDLTQTLDKASEKAVRLSRRLLTAAAVQPSEHVSSDQDRALEIDQCACKV